MVAVLGIGMIPFGRHLGLSVNQMGVSVVREALSNSGIRADEIECAFVANALGAMLFGDTTIGQRVAFECGMRHVPVVNVENACTSGSTALWLAWNGIKAGQYDIAIVLGVEKMCVPNMGLINSGRSEIDSQLGLVTPASFAMRALRHMHEFGTTRAQMASVVTKSRRHGALSDFSMFRKQESIADILGSPVVSDPLTRSECCAIADGAAAVILGSDRIGRKFGSKVRLESVVLRSGFYQNPADLVRWRTDTETAKSAYEESGIGPEGVDLIECHDAFSIAEILHIEALGFCAPGEGGVLSERGDTSLGGRIPVNVSGGLLSRGHPVAATGVAQVVEIYRQLLGRGRACQVAGAKVGLAQCMGGDLNGDTKSCTVSILSC